MEAVGQKLKEESGCGLRKNQVISPGVPIGLPSLLPSGHPLPIMRAK
jgi:hypothetical protein